jgi:DNA-directed RNA polymerase specialized sigma24 family protein
VLAAGERAGRESQQALAALCQAYWYPLYVYVRRRARDAHEAQDLTQKFFVWLLEKEALAVAQPQRGRFRAFLLTSLKNFLANERDKAMSAKRGGGRLTLSLDFDDGESRYAFEPAHEATPERLYQQQWALALLRQVMDRLENEFAEPEKRKQFERLKGFLTGDAKFGGYGPAADDLYMTSDAVRQAVHRMRKRYRELLRSEVAQTVANPADVEEEIRGLFECLE